MLFQADASRDSGDGRKSRVNRKYVIIGVTCAVVVAMVIAGVLVGVKFHLNSTTDIVKVYLYNSSSSRRSNVDDV